MPPAAGPNPIMNLIPVAAIFVIFYFFLIRPQNQERANLQKMLEGLKKGDRVLTNGGFYATIMGVRGQDLEVRIGENTKVLMARSGVSKLVIEADIPEVVGNGSRN